jgi:hypothetical protein
MSVPEERIAEIAMHINKSAVHAIPTNLAVSLFTAYSGTPIGITINTVCNPLGPARLEITILFIFSLFSYLFFYSHYFKLPA